MADFQANSKEGQQFERMFKERYEKLNSAQRKAVDTIEGPLLVVAGPGSGKTEILGMRVAKILKETQAYASNILCLTFTDSASQNMRDRLSRLIGDRAYEVAIHTFHNFCVDIIRKHGEFFYHGATFRAADPITQIAVLEGLFNALAHDNPLRSFHPEEGFVYLKATQSAIGNIKKSGLSPAELVRILEDNEKGFENIEKTILPAFEERLGKKDFGSIERAIQALADLGSKRVKEKGDSKEKSTAFHSIEESVASSVADALSEASKKEETEPLSKWKTKWIVKDDSGRKRFKDALNLERMCSFAAIYAAYQTEMHRLGYFDFDDMILDVIQALSTNARLRYELQEQYQYLLVDEFQDTNNAQMRILSLLTSAPEHNGRPNIMVVGDDDQAIYKFQGAELSNILDFRHRYADVGVISMTDNYRSTQGILDLAMNIMRKGEKRLENLIPDLSKQLVSKKDHVAGIPSDVSYHLFETHLHEYKYVAQKIRQLIDRGKKPEEIAVIGRKHANLEAIVPFLRNEKVPIKYEREQNVFAEPHIREIITIARYISSVVMSLPHEVAQEDLMPSILSFPFWGIARIDIWNISLEARRSGRTWLEVMQEIGERGRRDKSSTAMHIGQIAEFLIELSVDAKSTPLELMLDRIIGAHVALAVDTDKEDVLEDLDDKKSSAEFGSPFRAYYFSGEKFSHARSEYLSFLSSLRVFINAIRAFDGFETLGNHLTIADLVRFVDMYEKNNLSLNDESPFVTARSAVNLMSAHKSKGLEFDTVFVLSCQDDVWASRGLADRIPFPINLPVKPAGDSEDDQLRLFYVALTRAKDCLFLTAHEVKEGGKKASRLRFLVDAVPETDATIDVGADSTDRADGAGPARFAPEAEELLESAQMSYHTTTFLDEENALLKGLVENYKLSVTHLNNFLNIPKGGPRLFFEQNLLRFPQSKTPAGAYGSAIHSTLECILLIYKRDGKLMPIEEIESEFEKFLTKEKLHPADFKLFSSRGKAALKAFMKKRGDSFKDIDVAELDFARESILISVAGGLHAGGGLSARDGASEMIGKAFITGKIDKVSTSDDIISVHDYKTGRAFESFEEATGSLAVKGHHYKNQLLFYKILMEHSAYCREVLFPKLPRGEHAKFGDRKVTLGVIEFVEPVGTNKEIHCAELPLEEEDADRMKQLAIAVYARIQNLDFEIPDEIKEKIAKAEYKNDLDSILDFEEYLLGGL
jgi:DNA helicase-2/ATP-dependent DNA helicase PcrA